MKRLTGLLLALMMPVVTFATSAADTQQAEENIRKTMNQLAPGVELTSISESSITGLYQVSAGPLILYVSKDGRYMMQGRLIDTTSGENLTESAQKVARLEALNAVGEDTMIVYQPEKQDYTISVFTDIDCGYCRKLHREMDGYLKNGIKVRYLFYPRAGVDSGAGKMAESVWCAKDSKQAMTDAKAGVKIDTLTCANPVEKHHALGSLMDVDGTPTIILDDGEKVPGYVPPDKLKAYLDEKKLKQSLISQQ